MAKAYITDYGNYGVGEDLLEFESTDLTPEQWETVSELSDYDRLPYIRAVLAGANLSKWEN